MPSPLELRDYQREALERIEDAYGEGISRQLVALPTGTGKTVVLAHLIHRRGGRAVVLVHREELIRQTVEKLGRVGIPDSEIGVVKAEEDGHAARVVVASIQTVSRKRRLERLVPDFATVVVDEAHHSPADSYGRVLEHLGVFRGESPPLTVGFTATPQRADGRPLGELWTLTCHRSILDMVKAGWLCNIRGLRVSLEADFDGLRTRAGDFLASELGELLSDVGTPETVAGTFVRHHRGRKALVYLPTRELARETAGAFGAAGVPVGYLDSETPSDERREILTGLRTGELRAVVNVGVLTEGFDEPSVDCVMIARPTKSGVLYRQMIGRGTRPHPGKEDCLVVDFVGASSRHDLVTAPALFGTDPGTFAREGLDLTQSTGGAPEGPRRGPVSVAPVDLFGRKPLKWMKFPESGRYALPFRPKEFLVLEPAGYLYDVLYLRPGAGVRRVEAGLSLEHAQNFAEGATRERGARWLVDLKAPWRSGPASPKQLSFLQSLGVRIPEERPLSKGEASDLINGAQAEKALGRPYYLERVS